MKNFAKQLTDEQNLMIEVPSVRNIAANQNNEKNVKFFFHEKKFNFQKSKEILREALLKDFREEVTRNFVKTIALMKDSGSTLI